jgi:hypothetical protein
VLSIGLQLTETLQHHLKLSSESARSRAVELLRMVGIAEPERRLKQYPHHFSGGMRQRVMIAMALACEPKLIIADEPTTALDVTIQAQILELMKDLTRRLHHTQPRRGRPLCRPRQCHVCRPYRRKWLGARHLLPPTPSLYPRTASIRAAHGPRTQRAPRSGARTAAGPDTFACWLRVPAEVPVRSREM